MSGGGEGSGGLGVGGGGKHGGDGGGEGGGDQGGGGRGALMTTERMKTPPTLETVMPSALERSSTEV